MTASFNKDYTAGTVTGFGFYIAQPSDATATKYACTKYKTDGDNYVFIGALTDKTVKAQAYVEYTPVDSSETVTRYSNTVTNIAQS